MSVSGRWRRENVGEIESHPYGYKWHIVMFHLFFHE